MNGKYDILELEGFNDTEFGDFEEFEDLEDPEWDEIDNFEFGESEDWQGEVSRRSPEYIRWVQRSLNQILGTRLVVDGIMGPLTRSAVRSFQRRAGITVDGIVGPQTERALIAAGASRPPNANRRPTSVNGNLPASSSPGKYTNTPPKMAGVSRTVIGKIAQYDNIIERIAAVEKFNPNWVRGVIAAESGGNANSGKGSGGYKGLMQAGKSNDQLDPENSIRAGIQKLKLFRASVLRLLKENKIDIQSLGEETLIRLTMVAYNAGPGTLKKAMNYAIQNGDIKRWMEPENFQRALLYYGAYSVRVALKSCLEGPYGDKILSEFAILMYMSEVEIQNKFLTSKGWNTPGIWKFIGKSLSIEKKRWTKKIKEEGLTLSQARNQVPNWLLCSAAFKHKNLRTWYVDRVIVYKRHYDRLS